MDKIAYKNTDKNEYYLLTVINKFWKIQSCDLINADDFDDTEATTIIDCENASYNDFYVPELDKFELYFYKTSDGCFIVEDNGSFWTGKKQDLIDFLMCKLDY